MLALDPEDGRSSTPDGRISTPGDPRQGLLKDRIKQDLLELSKPIYVELMGKIKTFLRDAIFSDPDMWPSLKTSLCPAVDQFLDDLDHEIGRNLQDAFLQRSFHRDEQLHNKYAILKPLYSFRAFVLYHYLPFDKMLFGRLNDPYFLLMYLVTCVPIHGVRIVFFSVVLLMLVLPGPPDEYQLINFVLLCKGMQFISSGICQLGKGAILYFFCYIAYRDHLHPEHLITCIDNHGPGAHDGMGMAMDYLGSIILVWVAFGLLSWSEKHAADRRGAFEDEAEERKKNDQAGGRFRALLRYDRMCFVASVVLLFLLVLPQIVHMVLENGLRAIADLKGDPQFNAKMFWCCVLYSLLSLPFFPFMISGLQEVMTHCYATGFNRHGACVAYEGATVEKVAEPKKKNYIARKETFLYSGVARVWKILNSGAEYRNETSALNYKAGDLFRGIYNEYYVKKRKRTGSAEHNRESFSNMEGIKEQVEEEEEEDEDKEDYGETLIFNIASASIPADKMQEDYKGSAAFVVEVTAGQGLDGETALASFEDTVQALTSSVESSSRWYVVRRFPDFESLAERLGPRCKKFPNAPFPARVLIGTVKGSQLEQRRSQLEIWLTKVLEDPRCHQERWNKQMTNFLSESMWHETDLFKIRRQSGDFVNLPQQFGEEIMSGPLERAKPLTKQRQAHIQNTVGKGKEFRGASSDGHYKFGDYSRGLVATLQAATSTASCMKPPARGETTHFEEDSTHSTTEI